MKVRIIVDSTTDVTAEIKDRLTVVPLVVRFGDTEYIDGVTIDHSQFYEKLVESDELPTTSQPTPDEFAKVYKEAVDRGEEVVVITLSQNLSGTYQSAIIAAEDYQGKVFVVDSKSVAIGTAILAEMALNLVDEGKDAATIAEIISEQRDNICIVAMLDTLEYLKRGGRISKTVAFAGGLLSIKPVVTLRNGEIIILGKARGSKQGNNLLIGEIEAAGGVDYSKPVLLGYTGLSDLLLQKYVEDSASLWEGKVKKLRFTPIGSVIGTHAGPGAIAAAFFKNNG